jgi:hypothetical protein
MFNTVLVVSLLGRVERQISSVVHTGFCLFVKGIIYYGSKYVGIVGMQFFLSLPAPIKFLSIMAELEAQSVK